MKAKLYGFLLIMLSVNVNELPAQTCNTIYSFTNYSDGLNPKAGLVLSGDTLYGTASDAGGGEGTVFKVGTNGSNLKLLKFGSSGAAVVLSGNTLYGTTYYGDSFGSYGTIFKLTLPPPQLLVTTVGNTPVVFWRDDGFTRTLQTTTNLQSGNWKTASNGVSLVGLQATNLTDPPNAFFRLQ